jgi:hypothetical protein
MGASKMKLQLETDRAEFIEALIEDEELQNSTLVPFLKESVLFGSSIDCLVDDGTFGLSADNPIPVNGPLGQQTYLSKLRTPKGLGFFFHRLGSIGRIDVYKLVSFDGASELTVYLDMYHPRRSRKAIEGFYLDDAPSVFTGFTITLNDFPFDFESSLNELPGSIRDAYASPSQIRPILESLRNKDGDPQADAIVSDWRKLVTSDDWDRALEQRGFIVPTYGGAFEVPTLSGRRFGWTPSKALQKRRGMTEGELYDPASTLVLDAWDQFQKLFDEEAFEETGLTPDRVFFDGDGPYVSFIMYEGDPEKPVTNAFKDFFTSFYCLFRKYPMVSWESELEVPYGTRNHGQSTRLCFRWTNDTSALGSEFMVGAPPQTKYREPSPFFIEQNGALEALRVIQVGICYVCNTQAELWCNSEQFDEVMAYVSGKNRDKKPDWLTLSERELLITGTHTWCWDSFSA